jgi:hypothetical protein
MRRASLRPLIRVVLPPAPPPSLAYEPLASPASHEELADWGARASRHVKDHLAKVFEPARREPPAAPAATSGEALFASTWARECFEEIAMLSSQRRPLLGDDWRTSIEIEQRMLRSLDAFVSLGEPALSRVESLVLDAPAVDPPRAYAAGVILGSVAGRDTLGMAERIVRSMADPIALSVFGDALMVAPHPTLWAMLARWLRDSDPTFRSVAARVLCARNAATPEQLRACLADRPEVAAHALVPLMLAGDKAVDAHLHDALASADPALRHAGWIAMAIRSRRQAAERLRIELGGAHGDAAAALLAAVGNKGDARRLIDRATEHASPALLDAVGVAGSVDGVSVLLTLLRSEDGAIALAAAAALERITGAALRRDVELAPEQLDPPELPEAKTGGFEGAPLALRQLVSDPRFLPAEGSPDTVELPPPDPELWQAWWDEHRARFQPDTRYRMGEPYSTLVAWRELDGPTLDHGQRQRSGDELVVLLGTHSGFSADRFVVQQEQALALWRPAAEKRVEKSGAWPA